MQSRYELLSYQVIFQKIQIKLNEFRQNHPSCLSVEEKDYWQKIFFYLASKKNMPNLDSVCDQLFLYSLIKESVKEHYNTLFERAYGSKNKRFLMYLLEIESVRLYVSQTHGDEIFEELAIQIGFGYVAPLRLL